MNFICDIARNLGCVNDWVSRRLLLVASAMIVLMTSVILLQVICRYFFNNALSWPEELARYAMVWLTFASAPYAYKKGLKVKVTLLTDRIAPRLQKVSNVICNIIVLLRFLLFVHTFAMAKRGLNIAASSMNFNLFYVYVCMPISFILIGSIAVEKILSVFANIKTQ